MNFKKEFSKRKIEVDMKTVDLAKMLGRSRETICKWFSHPENVQTIDFVLLLDALKYSPEEVKMIYSDIIDKCYELTRTTQHQ